MSMLITLEVAQMIPMQVIKMKIMVMIKRADINQQVKSISPRGKILTLKPVFSQMILTSK